MVSTLRILIADDEQGIVWLWARLLQSVFDAEIVAVFDGRTALARVGGDERFDLIITDLQMPGASGIDVLRAATRHSPPIPVVLSSGHTPAHVLAEASRLGVCGVVTKPFDIDEAAQLVREVLRSRGLVRTAHANCLTVTDAVTREKPSQSLSHADSRLVPVARYLRCDND